MKRGVAERYEYAYVQLNGTEYLEDMQLRLGTFFDLGLNQCGLDGQYVAHLFVNSGLAQAFEFQSCKYVAGMSGAELLNLAFERCGLNRDIPNEPRWNVSPDYWVGYSLPYFQTHTAYTYQRLFDELTYDDLRGLHYRYQDRTEDEFVQGVLNLVGSRNRPNRLKEIRKLRGFTQKELAFAAGVSLQSLRLYEQGAKDINRAAADTVRRLSRALCCQMEDLLEMPQTDYTNLSESTTAK